MGVGRSWSAVGYAGLAALIAGVGHGVANKVLAIC